MELNNREIATLIWGGLAVCFFALKPRVRSAMGGVIGALFQPILLKALGTATLWIGLCVFLMERQGLWGWDNLKTTIVWAVTFAFVTMFDVAKIGKPDFLSSIVRDIFSVTTVVVFVTEFATFNLLGELILIPILVFLGLLQGVAASKTEFSQVSKLLDGFAILVVISLFSYSIWRIMIEFSAFTQRSTALEFAVPIILSSLFLPFIFLFGLWVTYERVFASFHYSIPNEKLRAYARRRSLLAFCSDLEMLDRWRTQLIRVRPATRGELDKTITEIKSAKRREESPPLVDSQDGWSPYAAKDFLKNDGLATSAYQDLGEGEWSCSSTLLDMDDGLLPNRLGYYILGDMLTAKRLRLKLYINNPTLAEAAEKHFCDIGLKLLEKAGVGDQASLLNRLPSQPGRLDGWTNTYVVTLSRENWQGGIPGGYDHTLTIRLRAFNVADN